MESNPFEVARSIILRAVQHSNWILGYKEAAPWNEYYSNAWGPTFNFLFDVADEAERQISAVGNLLILQKPDTIPVSIDGYRGETGHHAAMKFIREVRGTVAGVIDSSFDEGEDPAAEITGSILYRCKDEISEELSRIESVDSELFAIVMNTEAVKASLSGRLPENVELLVSKSDLHRITGTAARTISNKAVERPLPAHAGKRDKAHLFRYGEIIEWWKAAFGNSIPPEQEARKILAIPSVEPG